MPVEHVVVDLEPRTASEAHVLVVANQTVVGEPLLDRDPRARARKGPASFLLVVARERRAGAHPKPSGGCAGRSAILRGEGIDAHGQIGAPRPVHGRRCNAVHDERVDEIIVSTFPGRRAPAGCARDLVERLAQATELPVEHVVVERPRRLAV